MTPFDTDPYAILGLRKDADLEQVKSAYRRLVRIWHPDVCGRNMENIKRFLAIKDAYLLLKKRLQVQAQERSSVHSASARDGAPGNDVTSEGTFIFVQIGLKEALYGTSVEIEVAEGQDFCGRCSGLGQIADKDLPPCPACGGKGFRTLSWGNKDLKIICSKCSGKGKASLRRCPRCHGRGLITRKRKMEVKIPPGTRNGTILQVNTKDGAVEPAEGCFIEVEVEMPEGWIIHGRDIVSNVHIDCWTKLGGGYIEVETVDGTEEVFVAPGLGREKFIRLKKKGWIDRNGRRGDHLIRLDVLPPAGACPPEAMKLIQKLKRIWPCDKDVSPALPSPGDVHGSGHGMVKK